MGLWFTSTADGSAPAAATSGVGISIVEYTCFLFLALRLLLLLHLLLQVACPYHLQFLATKNSGLAINQAKTHTLPTVSKLGNRHTFNFV